MASYLRPRRGKKATAIAQLNSSAPLKRGEVFFEVPDAGTGTGAGRIKMGDGSTAYESLPYFLEPFDPDSATVGFTNATAAESDPYTTNATHTNAIVPSANLKTILTNLKQLLLNYNSQFTKLNNDLIPKYKYINDISNQINTEYINRFEMKMYRIGNLVIVNGSIVFNKSGVNIANVITDIPFPSNQSVRFITATYANLGTGMFDLTNGNLGMICGDAALNVEYNYNFSYVIV